MMRTTTKFGNLLVMVLALSVGFSGKEFLSLNATAEARGKYRPELELKINKGIAMLASVGLIGAVMALASCRSKLKYPAKQVVDTPVTCQVFEPIEVVESDSERTKEQVDVYNATWDFYCRGERWRD